VAICEFVRVRFSHSHPPVTASTAAAPFMMPETFSAILKLFFFQEPDFGPQDLIDAFGPEPFDSLFTEYYSAMNLQHVFVTRPESEKQRTTPFLQRKRFHEWLRMYIATYPNAMWHRLNIILRDVPVLIDPITEEPFKYTIIPRSCFPAEGEYAEEIALLEKRTKQYDEASDKIITEVCSLTINAIEVKY
jgi:hypothetical protein